MAKYWSASVSFVVTSVFSMWCLLFVKSHSIGSMTELRKFCLIFSIPGIKHDPDFHLFKRIFDKQMDKAGVAIFGDIPHESRMKNSENCTVLESTSIPKCAYNRIGLIYNSLVKDLKSLQIKLKTATKDAHYLYTTLLSAWYLDRLFLTLDCGPVNVKKPIPVVQWKFISKWSKMLKSQSRNEFCIWSEALSETASKNLRQNVRSTCFSIKDPICQLIPIFDIVDSIANLCEQVPDNDWNATVEFFDLEKAAFISFYSLRLKAPPEIANTFHVRTEREHIRKAILDLFFKIYDDFRKSDLTFIVRVLKVLPKSFYLPCEQTAQFPSFEWLICATSKSFSQLQAHIQTYDKVSLNKVQKQKLIISNVDYRSYIQQLKSTQIIYLSEKHSVSLDVAVADLKNNIQDRFHQLGTYFEKVATYEKVKLIADITYIKGRIEEYNLKFRKYSQELSKKMKVLFGLSISTAAADVAEAVAKLVIRIAMAGNPFKWIADSGNVDDIVESGKEIAQASELLTRAIRSTVNFHKLIDYSKEIATKLSKNERMIKNIGSVIENVKKSAESNDDSFQKHQLEFLDNYNNYSPQVAKDDLSKLDNYWDLFIDEVCEGIASTGSIVASYIKGISGYSENCMEAKTLAGQLVACQEETYDLQFEVVETMASVVRCLTQIQSSKIIGSGTRVLNPSGFGEQEMKALVAVSSFSYKIMQMTNVQMLCDILEYKHGKIPDACTGLSTDIDKLISLKDPECHQEFHYISVPSKPTSDRNDHSWLDLSKLYKGDFVQFQIPNSTWLTNHLHLLESQKMYSFYVTGFEVYVPAVSEQYKQLLVTARPTNINNRLHDESLTNFIISPVESMRMKYAEGSQEPCRVGTIPNPYSKCRKGERTLPRICPLSIGTECVDKNKLYPSIYSQFDIRLEGYESMKLDVPATNVPVKIGLKFCSVVPHRKRRSTIRAVRQTTEPVCCPPYFYYAESTNKCEQCPPGTRSFHNGLFCGEVIKILITPDFNSNIEFTFAKAEELCKENGSTVASLTVLWEARNSAAKSCDCGWLSNTGIDSISYRSECGNKACPQPKDVKFVHCTTVF